MIRVENRNIWNDVSVSEWERWDEVGSHYYLIDAKLAVEYASGCLIRNIAREPLSRTYLGIWEPEGYDRAFWQVRFIETDEIIPCTIMFDGAAFLRPPIQKYLEDSPWKIDFAKEIKCLE